MNGRAFLIVACILLWLEFSPTSGQDYEDCPYNEVEVDCVTGCNTCEFVNKTCQTPDECEPGCDCKDGYLRNKFGYCIPRRYCDSSNGEPIDLGGREVANSGGCPNSELCIFSCMRRGFAAGICLGPEHQNCNCYTNNPVPAGQDTPENKDIADSGGCPNSQICTLSCKRRGFTTGLCLGPRHGYCNCFSRVPTEEKREVANSGGCPNAQICTQSCKRRGFTTGLCLGPKRGYCNCYSRLPSEGKREVAHSGGCPNAQICIRSCKRRNFETGICLGPKRGYCNCYSRSNSRN